MENEVIDNQTTQTVDTFQEEAPKVDVSQAQEQTTEVQETQKPYAPFSSGKERLKINGVEQELDWDTAKRYASLGGAAYKKMEEAAEVKKRTEQTYRELLEMAYRDPEGLIGILNPNYRSQAGTQANGQSNQVAELDPRDQKIAVLERQLNEVKSFTEQQEIETERQAINREMSEAEGKYSGLKGNKFVLNYIKSEYAKALRNGLETTIDEIAFLVSQELAASQKQSVKEVQDKIKEKQKKAPVSMVSSGSEIGNAKPMSLDDVKRLAGRM